MKSSELRIGNFFNNSYNGELSTIYALGRTLCSYKTRVADDGQCSYDCCIPIPLTYDWLVNFGFYAHSGDYFKAGFRLNRVFAYELLYGVIKLNYVHQLQNLYFAI